METKNEKPKESNKKFTIVGYIGEVYEIRINRPHIYANFKNDLDNIIYIFGQGSLKEYIDAYDEFKDSLNKYQGMEGFEYCCNMVFPGCISLISALWGVDTTLVSVLPEKYADLVIKVIKSGQIDCLNTPSCTAYTSHSNINLNYCIGLITKEINVPTILFDIILYYGKCYMERPFKPQQTYINEFIEKREISKCIVKYEMEKETIVDTTIEIDKFLHKIVEESDVIFTLLAGYKLPQIYVNSLKDNVILVFAPMRYADLEKVNEVIKKIINQKKETMYNRIYVFWDTTSLTQFKMKKERVPDYVFKLKVRRKRCIEKELCISINENGSNYQEFMKMWNDIKDNYSHIWNSNIVFLHALFELDDCVNNVKFAWKKANQNEINVYYGPINVRNVDPEWEKLIKELIPGNDEELFALGTIYAKEVLSQQDSRFKKDEEALKFGITAVVYRIIHRQTVDLPIDKLMVMIDKIFPSDFSNYVKKIKII